jgi:hypothetical protein
MRLLAIVTIAAASGSVALTGHVDAQEPRTRAERTEYRETSRYADVMAFLEAVTGDARLHPAVFGYSF